MKLLVVCFTLLVAAHGYDFKGQLDAQSRSISSEVVKLIEKVREQMPCGFPGAGIPPLAPLRFTHRELHMDGGAIGIDGEFDNFRLDGLNEFEIVELRVTPLRRNAIFKFHWTNATVTTDYSMAMGMGSMLETQRSGGAKVAVMDITASGEVKYNVGIPGSNLRMKSIKIYITVGNVKSDIENLSNIKLINRKLNQVIEEWIMLAINDNTENIALWGDRFLPPRVNNILGGGSARSVEEQVLQAKCNTGAV